MRRTVATSALFTGLIACIGLAACSHAPGTAPAAEPAPTPAAALAPAPSLAPASSALAAKAPPVPVRPADAVTLPDGLAYKVLRPGTGTQHPMLSDTVSANYSLWKPDGTFLEGTCTANPCKPATFPLDKLIPGWQEMIPKMTVGEKVQLWLTADLAYGDPPRKPNRPAGPLVFEIELLGIGKPMPPRTH